MLSFKEVEKVVTPPHKCPHYDLLMKGEFICDNLKFMGAEHSCIVTKCPFDNTVFEEITILEEV